MKRLLLTVIVAAFAVAVQADDAKSCQQKTAAKDKSGCCPSKVQVSDKAKDGSCPVAKSACCAKQQTAKPAKEKQQTAQAAPKPADSAN